MDGQVNTKPDLSAQLWELVRDGDVEGVSDCLKRGADPDSVPPPSYFPAHFNYSSIWSNLSEAAFRGDVEVARLLLNYGAVVDSTDVLGGTPFYWAASENNCECARLLLDRGANIHHKTKAGETPLFTAVAWNQHGTAELLFSHMDHLSIKEEIIMIVRHGLPVDLVKKKDTEMLKLLCKHGLLVSTISAEENGASLLHIAAKNGWADVLRVLLRPMD